MAVSYLVSYKQLNDNKTPPPFFLEVRPNFRCSGSKIYIDMLLWKLQEKTLKSL